ncbi:MAG: uracil-DNA glycosylase [Nitrospiraceae bacterium]|nr:MAG: uracil-DNA glycosylase [Nitrospiraceae bacterium]
MSRLSVLQQTITACRQCPRLVTHREQVAHVKIRRFRDCDYWGRPVPGFGSSTARLLIVGLAPAAHGGNRTGRMFTGDRSGDWLYRALHAAGFAGQPHSISRDDGMRLRDCYITAAVRCAPPGNKPLPEEFDQCRPFLAEELRLLARVLVVVALGRIAFEGYLKACRELGHPLPRPRPAFGHGKVHHLPWGVTLIGSYHPSQQNTFTGRLTAPMLNAVFIKARKALGA